MEPRAESHRPKGARKLLLGACRPVSHLYFPCTRSSGLSPSSFLLLPFRLGLWLPPAPGVAMPCTLLPSGRPLCSSGLSLHVSCSQKHKSLPGYSSVTSLTLCCDPANHALGSPSFNCTGRRKRGGQCLKPGLQAHPHAGSCPCSPHSAGSLVFCKGLRTLLHTVHCEGRGICHLSSWDLRHFSVN